ncbi:MAG: radical SAM protein [Thermoprotei archaeon]|nr:MAG: radical SAM protein [Thermoprotei archaeon]
MTRVSRALTRSGLPDIDYALNPYMGCSHGCIYCYARLYTRNKEISENWGMVVAVKENIVDLVKREARFTPKGVVGVSTITDPYQPVEAIYKLTRRSIEILLEHGFHVSLQTKSTLILRDLDLLLRHRDRVDVGFTITTLNTRISSFIEPSSPPPPARVEALKRIAEKGIETWIFYGPVIPGLNSDVETIERILQIAYTTGSKVLVDPLRVKYFMLEHVHPLYRYALATRAFDWDLFYKRVFELCREKGVECIKGFAEPSSPPTLDRYMKT